MKKQEVSRRLVDLIEPIVKPLGFQKHKGSEDWIFHKTTDFGYDEISVLIWPSGDIFYVGLGFTIRISEINKVYNPYSSFSENYYETSSTISAGINSFGLSPDGKIKVENETELDEAIKSLKEVLINKALPFFDHFTSAASLDDELNKEGRKAHLYLHDTDRSFVGIIAAALNNNPKFSYWEQVYRDRLKNASPSKKEKYEGLVARIKSIR